MKKLQLLFGLFCSIQLFGQQPSFVNPKPLEINKSDSLRWSNVPQLKYDKTKGPKLLPERVDNSTRIYFPDIMFQPINNCGQCSGVTNTYSYELNRILNRTSKNPQNIFSSLFNVLATAQGGAEHTLRTWENMKTIGCLTDMELGYPQINNGMILKYLNGYDLYYKAMQNQVDDYFSIPLDSKEGIFTMKQWLHNHLSGDSVGGIGIIYIGIPYPDTTAIPTGYDAGKIIIPEFTTYVNHSIAIVGYDDRIEWDFNHDGQITTDIDITGDGIVDVRDWEKGAVIIANSYGTTWGNEGFVYVMYRTLAMPSNQNGIWNRTMYVVKPKMQTKPKTTFRFSIAHRNKSRLKAYAGISSNCNSTSPEHAIEIPFFNSVHPSEDTLTVGIPLEFGFDVTSLLNYIQPGQKARFFFQILEVDVNNSYDGYIQNFSVIDYAHGSKELISNPNPVNIVNHGLTSLFVDITPEFSKPELTSNRLPNAEVGTPYRTQLTAQKGTPPYRFGQTDGYSVSESTFKHPDYNGLTRLTLPAVATDYITCATDFPILVYDSIHTDSIFINRNGCIHLRDHDFEWPFFPLNFTQLKAHTGIAPLMSQLVFDKPEFGVWKKSTPDSLFIRWIGRFEADPNSYLDFSVSIAKQGDIRFYYDSISYTSYSPWIRGISKGNGVGLAKVGNDFFIIPHTMYTCTFIPIDTAVSVTSEGVLSANPTAAFTNKKINLTILDNNDIETRDFTVLSTGIPPDLSITSYMLNSDNQGWYSPIDTVKIAITLKNKSGSTLHNVALKLISTSPNIEVLKSSMIVAEILPNSEIIVNNAFLIKASLLLNTQLSENLIIQNTNNGEQLAVVRIQLTPIIPIGIGEAIVDSVASNHLISNTTQSLLFPIYNKNRSAITGITASLHCSSNRINILDPAYHIDTIPPYSVDTLRFQIETSEVSTPGLVIAFSGELTDYRGTMVPYLKTYTHATNLVEDYENSNQLFVIPSFFSDTIPYEISNNGCNSDQSLRVTRRSGSSYTKYRTFSFYTRSNAKIEFDYKIKAGYALGVKRLEYTLDDEIHKLDTTLGWKHFSCDLANGVHVFTLKQFLLLPSDTVFIDNLSIPLTETTRTSYLVSPSEIRLKCRPDTILNFNIEVNNSDTPFSEIYYDIVPPVNTLCNWLQRQGAVTLTSNQSVMLPFNVSTVGLQSGEYVSYVRFNDGYLFSPVKVTLEVIDNYQPPASGTVTVYPNPALDKVSFDFISSDAKTASLELFDMLGRSAFYQEQNIDFGSDLRTLTFDISTVSEGNSTKGLYLYRLKVGDSLYHGKITIIK